MKGVLAWPSEESINLNQLTQPPCPPTCSAVMATASLAELSDVMKGVLAHCLPVAPPKEWLASAGQAIQARVGGVNGRVEAVRGQDLLFASVPRKKLVYFMSCVQVSQEAHGLGGLQALSALCMACCTLSTLYCACTHSQVTQEAHGLGGLQALSALCGSLGSVGFTPSDPQVAAAIAEAARKLLEVRGLSLVPVVVLAHCVGK